MTIKAEPVPQDAICSECHKYFDVSTGSIVLGWEHVFHVDAGPLLCRKCKDAVVVSLGSQ